MGNICISCGTELFVCPYEFQFFKILVLNFETILNYSVTLTRYRTTPDDDLLKSKHVGVPLNIFMYFNIKINILD